MDNRPYFFSFITQNGNPSWEFIAISGQYHQNWYPIETWTTTSNKKYVICRICYTQEQANKLISLATDIVNIIKLRGPDIYCVIDYESKKTILSVWKPSIPLRLEISSDYKYAYVDEGSDFDTIKQKILVVLGIDLISSEEDTLFAPLKEYRLNFDIKEEKQNNSNDIEEQINITI